MKKFREENKLLFYLSIAGLLFSIFYGITLKVPVWLGDTDKT